MTRPVLVGLLMAIPMVFQAAAREYSSDRRPGYDVWGPSVGRNAPEAITSGLAEQGANWLDTMANFYADPHVDNRGYFDYYRRPTYGSQRLRRQR